MQKKHRVLDPKFHVFLTRGIFDKIDILIFRYKNAPPRSSLWPFFEILRHFFQNFLCLTFVIVTANNRYEDCIEGCGIFPFFS